MKLKCMSVRPAGDNERKPALTRAAGHWGLILATCWVLLGVLGWLDFITGYELSFFVFYSVPVGVAAWYIGRWPAIGVALILLPILNLPEVPYAIWFAILLLDAMAIGLAIASGKVVPLLASFLLTLCAAGLWICVAPATMADSGGMLRLRATIC